ncbi:MAG: ShlB/FhaC/HecB family hemolysin secretion/activation protein [Pandoraea sp.]|nr:ShlB/FhaC/HecB family hemolysin secretion/activation protein [Pandoraea sp.]MDR3397095.1 ShlB/FhaC/HecB family hemolysin secretion/activation protein [Pandoraea sp.]
MCIAHGVTCASAIAQTSPGADAAAINARQQQRIEQQRQAQERSVVVNAPGVRPGTLAASEHPALPQESPCFPLASISLDVPDVLPPLQRALGASALELDPFAFTQEWLGRYRGQCVGQQGIALIVARLNRALLARGYVTSRVVVPEQDIATGQLHLVLIPGTIRNIHFSDAAQYGTWRNAFPTGSGELLRLRDLEQGLEQMKRVPSQDVTMQIVPTDVAGQSDVVIDMKRTKRWTLFASIDNSGARDTGKLQGSLAVGIDNPLGLNDILNVGAVHDLEFGDKRFGSGGWNAFYSIPWGYWTATVSASANDYHQRIAGVSGDFVTRGRSQNVDLKISRIIRRTQNDVVSFQARIGKRFGHSYVEDIEINQQYRNNAFVELGLTDRHYLGNAQLDASLMYRQGVAGLGTASEQGSAGMPTYRFRMAVIDANLIVPIAQLPLRYVATLHGQMTRDVLHYVDDLAIGGRYTVRGFDGESALAAEKGFYWRNELQWTPTGGISWFAGIDYGHVYGPNTAYLTGTQLAGAVVGVRASKALPFGFLCAELFFGKPIYKPANFDTARTTVGFSVSAQF